MCEKTRIAIIGTGWWSTTAHFPALQSHPDAKIVAIADQRPDTLAKAAKEYGIENTYTDYRQMLDNEDIDGVVIAVWHAAHYEVARACLEHDLHIMLEKPMVLVAKEARDLVELANQRQRELIIGYPYHFTPRALRARELLQSGQLGQVRYVNCYFASTTIDMLRGDDTPYGDLFHYPVTGPGDVYSDPSRSGGGQGHLQITHSAALMHFITGLRPVTVMALMDNLELKLDVIDAITVRMNNGAIANVGSTGNLQVSDPGKLSLQVNCDDGWLDIDFITGEGRIRHADGSDEHLERLDVKEFPDGCEQPDNLYPLFATASNLVDVISGKCRNGSPAEYGWWTVELLDAAYRSASSNGRSVSVESLYQ